MDAITRETRSLAADGGTAEPLIAATDLRFSVAGAAGPVNILRGLDLRIGRGEAVGLVTTERSATDVVRELDAAAREALRGAAGLLD